MKDLRDEVETAKRWIASAAHDYALNDLITAVAILADVVAKLIPENPNAATIEPAAPPMSKEPTNDLSFLD